MVKKKIISELKKIRVHLKHSSKSKTLVEKNTKNEKADEQNGENKTEDKGLEETTQQKDFTENILQEDIGFVAPVIEAVNELDNTRGLNSHGERLEETADSVILDRPMEEKSLYSASTNAGNYSGSSSYDAGASYAPGQIVENPLLSLSRDAPSQRRGLDNGFSSRRDSNPWAARTEGNNEVKNDLQRFQVQEQYRIEKEKENTGLAFQQKKRESF